MFCPACGTQNELRQGYCRQCGQALSAVAIAVEGSTDQSLQRLKAGQKLVTQGSATAVVFAVLGVILAILGFAIGEPALANIALINMLLGLAIGLPVILVGRSNLKRALTLLSGEKGKSGAPLLEASRQTDKMLSTEIGDSHQAGPGSSVTEHTTLNLEGSKPSDTGDRS